MQGKLKLSPLTAELNHDTSSLSSMSPYLILKYDEKEYRTEVAKGQGKYPNWNNQFEIEIKFNQDLIKVVAMDKKSIKSDQCIGEGSLVIDRSKLDEEQQKIHLNYKGEVAGTILFKCLYIPNTITQQYPLLQTNFVQMQSQLAGIMSQQQQQQLFMQSQMGPPQQFMQSQMGMPQQFMQSQMGPPQQFMQSQMGMPQQNINQSYIGMPQQLLVQQQMAAPPQQPFTQSQMGIVPQQQQPFMQSQLGTIQYPNYPSQNNNFY